jgi:hypothetical protein
MSALNSGHHYSDRTPAAALADRHNAEHHPFDPQPEPEPEAVSS